eukprot:11263256-Ditylum_brightwellii.AAC.1
MSSYNDCFSKKKEETDGFGIDFEEPEEIDLFLNSASDHPLIPWISINISEPIKMRYGVIFQEKIDFLSKKFRRS